MLYKIGGWLVNFTVKRLLDRDLNAVDWGEGPRALETPVKAIVGVGV